MSKRAILVILLLVLPVGIVVFGCKSADVELNQAQRALEEAADAGALQYAKEEYEAAEALIEKAKLLMSRGDHPKARELLIEARHLATQAKGKSWIAHREQEMSDAQRRMKEEELRKLKGRREGRHGLLDVFFDYDKFNIRSGERTILQENSKIISKSSVRQVVVEGYCDTRGTEEYNLALGQKRADAVKAYLVGLGVSLDRITAVSRGETDKFAASASERSFQENRRAHFVTAE
ncbi:MAG: OmpA family protein [Candidatus Dadabacteria bacterium]|nr:OmpA family protein [Candidatus Dadabacteria bacterium]